MLLPKQFILWKSSTVMLYFLAMVYMVSPGCTVWVFSSRLLRGLRSCGVVAGSGMASASFTLTGVELATVLVGVGR